MFIDRGFLLTGVELDHIAGHERSEINRIFSPFDSPCRLSVQDWSTSRPDCDNAETLWCYFEPKDNSMASRRLIKPWETEASFKTAATRDHAINSARQWPASHGKLNSMRQANLPHQESKRSLEITDDYSTITLFDIFFWLWISQQPLRGIQSNKHR